MHGCFYGGGSGSRINKSVAVIRDLTKTMKAMTLKVKGRGGGGRLRHRRHSTAEDEELQKQAKDASSSTSSSAKIAPAQQRDDEEREAEKRHQHCDKCCSPLDNDRLSAADEEKEQGAAPHDDAEEWVAEPEPGVLMTLAPRGDGANYLRRIRFSEEQFPDARAARAWWEDNFDRIVELYSIVVQPMHGEDDGDDPAAPVTPCQSEDDEHQRPDGELEYSASCSASTSTSAGSASNLSGPSSGSGSANKVESPILGLVTEPNGRKRSKRAQHYQKTRQEQ